MTTTTAGLIVAERLNHPTVHLQGTRRNIHRDVDPRAVTRRFVHHFFGATEMSRHDVLPLGDLLRGRTLARGGGGRGGIVFRLRHRRIRLWHGPGFSQIRQESQRAVPGVLGEIEFDDTLLRRGADGDVEPISSELKSRIALLPLEPGWFTK